MERLTEKQHLKLNKQEAYKLYMDTLHELALVTNELALVTNELYDYTIRVTNMVSQKTTTKKDNLYAF